MIIGRDKTGGDEQLNGVSIRLRSSGTGRIIRRSQSKKANKPEKGQFNGREFELKQ